MEAKKKRLIFLDYIKAISIIIIITYHFSVGLNIGSTTNAFYINILNKGVWGLLGVAMFFMISGASLMYNYGDNLDVKKYYKKRFLNIYPAYWIAYSIVFLYSFCKYKGLVWVGPIIKLIYSFLGMDGYLMPYTTTFSLIGDWFVGAIVIIYILFPLYKKLMEKYPKLFLVLSTIVFLAVIIFEPFKMPLNRDIFVSSFMFILGMYAIKYVEKTNCVQAILALIFGIVFFVLAKTPLMNIAVLFSSTCAGLLFIFFSYFFKKPKIVWLEELVKYISKNCYYLFLIHHYLIVEIESFFKNVMLDKYGTFILYIIIWVAILLLSKLIHILTNKFTDIFSKYVTKNEVKIIIALTLIVTAFACVYEYRAKAIEKSTTLDNTEIDYSLIFDSKYYSNINEDLKSLSDEELLNQFISYGMNEGRRASYNFDVVYYKENNEDLAEAFGENLPLYYYHYAQNGYKEGRLGSKEDIKREIFDINVACKLSDSNNLKVSLNTNCDLEKEEYYILQLLANENNINNYINIQKISKKEVKLEKGNITDKYVVAKKINENEYEQVSNFAFIENPEILCENSYDIAKHKTNSKKGLQISYGHNDEVSELEPSYVFINFIVQNILLMDYQENNTITYNYNGKDYYFNKEEINVCDNTVSYFTNKDIQVISSVLSIKRDGYDILYYPNIDMENEKSFYAINTTDEESQMYFEAIISFLSQRYNGQNKEYGLIAKWVIGNEVNESGTYNYMGEKELSDYMEEYSRTFRIGYNIIKSNNKIANVYVPLEPFWGIDSNKLTYGGREFVNYFNEFIKKSGNIDWGVAYHAYSYPLCDPKVLNDNIPMAEEDGTIIKDLVTKQSFYTAMITMENLDVLTDYMKQENMLNPNNEVRSIILSEQGFTANSNVYGPCEALQAASLIYSYYKAEMNEDIDAFIYFLHIENNKATLGNDYYKFGLSYMENEKIKKRLSYDVFRDMDKKDSLENLSYLKDILNIKQYDDVIKNFNSSKFENFIERKDKNTNKIEISNATTNKIDDQKYTGNEVLPNLEIYYNGELLKNDIDYDVVYLNNEQVGTAKVLVVGLDRFYGILETEFQIVK